MFSIKTIVILSFLGLLNFAFAEMSIDQQISAIKTASPEQRVKMMNNLKRNIATMQASQRTETINKLRANLSHHKESPPQAMYNNGDQNKQMNHNNEMQYSEIMMQKGAADRFVQKYDNTPMPNQPPATHEATSTHNDFSNNWRK